MSKRFLIILEIIWIITGILCIGAAIKYAIAPGGKMIYIFLLMSAVSFLFAFARHRERKKG